MPFYDIQHALSLTPAQHQKLAQAITHLHAHTFKAPSLFVNIKFTERQIDKYFIGGHERSNVNRIFVHLRSGSSRSPEVLAKLAQDVERVWYETWGIINYEQTMKRNEVGKKELQAVFIIPGLVAREKGVSIPKVCPRYQVEQ